MEAKNGLFSYDLKGVVMKNFSGAKTPIFTCSNGPDNLQLHLLLRVKSLTTRTKQQCRQIKSCLAFSVLILIEYPAKYFLFTVILGTSIIQ